MHKTFKQESNIAKIYTKHGTYKYKKVNLYYGRKIIDMNVARKNLLDVKRIFDSLNIPFGLMYGTLLGAVREKNFIEYDEDVDIYVLDEFRESVFSSLFDLRKLGFEVARYEEDLLSIIRDDDYIDIYFFKKTFWGKRRCNRDIVKAKFLEQNRTIKFLNETFKVPYNYIKLLEILYDKD
jgi:phosphorylcholine metabolism protein LicD